MNDIHTHPANLGFYRAPQAARLLGISKTTFWLWAQQKVVRGIAVPQPIKISAGITVWRRADVHAFVDELSKLGGIEYAPSVKSV